MDEEIIGEDRPVGKSHLQKGGDGANYKSSASGNAVARNRGQSAPIPVSQGGQQDEKETAKQRLQRLIRDFAHDAVGPGLEVEAQTKGLIGVASASAEGVLEALLRMDRRLSRLELWPISTQDGPPAGSQPLYFVVLQQVAAINKGIGGIEGGADGEEDGGAATEGTANFETLNNACLSVVQRAGPELRLIFDSPVSRDRAYTCLRIFQMSVDQSMEGASRENESDMTGYESSSMAASP